MFHYTYVLKCADGKFYVGSTSDIDRRFQKHASGYVPSTRARRPMELVYYEACRTKEAAEARERYFKTGYGRRFLKERIQ